MIRKEGRAQRDHKDTGAKAQRLEPFGGKIIREIQAFSDNTCFLQSELKDTDGLKLSLEANLDIEIELKASIRGDLTLSLL